MLVLITCVRKTVGWALQLMHFVSDQTQAFAKSRFVAAVILDDCYVT